MEPVSPALQADSLLFEPPGKPAGLGSPLVGSHAQRLTYQLCIRGILVPSVGAVDLDEG